MARNKVHDKCGAKTRAGTPCKRPAGWGTDHVGDGKCKLHGGKSTGAKSQDGKQRVSQNAIKHGAYIDKVINEMERQVYDWLYQETIRKYELDPDNAIHMATLHRACITYLKLIRLDEWEMEEEIQAINAETEKDPETGKEKLKGQNVYNEDAEIIGKRFVVKERLRWSKTPNWEGHFQKYIQMLGVDRATEQKMKADNDNAEKVVDAFGWIWGNKSETASAE